MSTLSLVPSDILELYEVHEWRNATAILQAACSGEWGDILICLRSFRLSETDILKPGGRKSTIVTKLEAPLVDRGWKETSFSTSIKVDDTVFPSPTHKVDQFKNKVAIEVEWNNKDPFYDRDLNNFRLLFDLRVIDVGVIITRCSELQKTFDRLGKGKSYGQSTTHIGKLLPKIEGGGGGGCPILVFGIKEKLLVP